MIKPKYHLAWIPELMADPQCKCFITPETMFKSIYDNNIIEYQISDIYSGHMILQSHELNAHKRRVSLYFDDAFDPSAFSKLRSFIFREDL